MLDLKTVLVVTFAISALQAVAWIFIWGAWRKLYELRFFAVGYGAIALGLLLMISRDSNPAVSNLIWANIVIKLGLVLLAEGLARFLGQPRYSAVGVVVLIVQIGAWSVAVAADLGNIALRIHLSTAFTVIIMSVMCFVLLRDRTQPAFLRWITIGVLLEYMLASIVQSVIEQGLAGGLVSPAGLSDRNSWYFLQGALFQIAFFACILFMVSSRLSTDLRDKNDALLAEVEQRRWLETQLSASLETERALREEQADFLRVVSHEFRTPLAVIRNASDMIGLVGDKSPEATRERIAAIGEALDRLFGLIDRFMANDRDGRFQPELIRIGGLMAEVRLHFEMTGRGERLAVTIDEEALTLFGDPEMLATVLINLVDNALKYSSEREPVKIAAQQQDGNLVIRVSDRGIGIPNAELHKVGRRFFRASNTTAGTGTGLGLYSSRKLLAYHNGTLRLAAGDAEGVTAIVLLPLPSEAGSTVLEEASA